MRSEIANGFLEPALTSEDFHLALAVPRVEFTARAPGLELLLVTPTVTPYLVSLMLELPDNPPELFWCQGRARQW